MSPLVPFPLPCLEGAGSGSDDDAHALAGELSGRAWRHLRQRLSASSVPKLATAMRHLKRFEREIHRARPELFKVPAASGELRALLFNEWSLILFVEFLAFRKSKRTGEHLAADTIAEYVGMIKKELSVQFGFALAGDGQRLPAVIKGLRRERPAKERKRRRGIRRRQLIKAAAADRAFLANNALAANEWALATTAWQGLTRAAELAAMPPVAHRRTAASETQRLPSRADLSFGKAGDQRYACVMLRPVKKKLGESQAKVPILFAEGDGDAADTYLALRRLVRLDPVPKSEEAHTPLFRCGTAPFSVKQVRKLAKRIMRTSGGDPKDAGGHSFRVGGGSDLADQGASPLLLQSKGRWASDIGRIYARMTRRAQLAASRLMQQQGGRDLEELFPNFTQGR